jgi:glycosyltransferase involved in cell wall biosynthesis
MSNDKSYSIVIVTFVKRYEKYFKPLIRQIKEARPNVEIVVGINGEHKQLFDQDYRKNILTFLAEYSNVYPIMFTEHRSLSKIWNTCLINCTNDMVLRIDDDITIADNSFWPAVDQALNMAEGDCFKINGSWSHTVLNRKQINEVGWFDERLLGGGEEDGDMEWRWSEKYRKPFRDIRGFPIINHWNDVDFDECLVNMKKCNGKRSMFNKVFILKKYHESPGGAAHGIMCENGTRKLICVDPTPNQYPNEAFYWRNKDNL